MSSIAHADAPSSGAADGRQRVLDAAAQLFLRQGFSGTSQRHIATASGMKAASLYHHFSSKNDLLATILHRALNSGLKSDHFRLDGLPPGIEGILQQRSRCARKVPKKGLLDLVRSLWRKPRIYAGHSVRRRGDLEPLPTESS